MSGTLVVAVVAVVFSGVSAVAAAIALWFSHLANAREDEAAERDRRRLQLEEVEALAAQQARPSAVYLGPGDSGGREYRFQVTNDGRETATDLDAQLVDQKGNPASERTRTNRLKPGDSAEFKIAVQPDAINENPLFLRFTWFDRSGRPSRTSHVDVPVS